MRLDESVALGNPEKWAALSMPSPKFGPRRTPKIWKNNEGREGCISGTILPGVEWRSVSGMLRSRRSIDMIKYEALHIQDFVSTIRVKKV